MNYYICEKTGILLYGHLNIFIFLQCLQYFEHSVDSIRQAIIHFVHFDLSQNNCDVTASRQRNSKKQFVARVIDVNPLRCLCPTIYPNHLSTFNLSVDVIRDRRNGIDCRKMVKSRGCFIEFHLWVTDRVFNIEDKSLSDFLIIDGRSVFIRT